MVPESLNKMSSMVAPNNASDCKDPPTLAAEDSTNTGAVEFEWKDELPATYICRLCNKTFYNAVALKNHKNLHHDLEFSSEESEEITLPMRVTHTDRNLNGLFSFRFIPLKEETDGQEPLGDITTRTFTQDTTYLVVKMITEELDIDYKRRRLEGVVKRTQLKPGKTPVDLRGPFTCAFPTSMRPNYQCRQTFFNCCDYSVHYREEHTKRRKAALRCQVCEKSLDLQNNTFTISCRLCAETFIEGSQYDEHTRIFHAKMRPYKCNICTKRFTQQGGLQQHLRMHTGIRPFGCTFCPKAFTQKAGLDQHLRIHTKVKPFRCVICNKCFSQSVHLRQHMRTHTNIQPFACTVCGRRFKQTSHLKFHMRSHGDSHMMADAVERYTLAHQMESRTVLNDGKLGFLNLSNLQPVGDGETLYYAAELAPSSSQLYNYSQSQMSSHMMSL